MAEPVNLNQYQKAKARVEAAARADENAVRHGRSKARIKLEKAREKKRIDAIDQHESEL